jgi:hypothetical protein
MVESPRYRKTIEDLEAEAVTLAERLKNVQQAIVSLHALDFNQERGSVFAPPTVPASQSSISTDQPPESQGAFPDNADLSVPGLSTSNVTAHAQAPQVVGTVGSVSVPPAQHSRLITGVTDAIRDIVRAAARPIKATDIRNALERRGFKGEHYRNLLMVVHATLRRRDGKEIKRVKRGTEIVYTWNETSPLGK